MDVDSRYRKDDMAFGCFGGTICLGVGIGVCIVGGPVGLGIGIPLIIFGLYLICRNRHGCASNQYYMRHVEQARIKKWIDDHLDN
jgi:hypothetical protein